MQHVQRIGIVVNLLVVFAIGSASFASPLPHFAACPLTRTSLSDRPLQICTLTHKSSLKPAMSSFGSVTVEDESQLKQCSGCQLPRPLASYSAAQLKKKGKRT